MLKKIQLKTADVAGIAMMIWLLIAVRVFQDILFYDPLIPFFKSSSKVLPDYNPYLLFLGLLFRYLLNTILSLVIIWLFFKDRAVIKLSALLYIFFFIVLISAFFIVAGTNNPNLLVLFYLRRFIIQPLFLILFVPAFYYQKKT